MIDKYKKDRVTRYIKAFLVGVLMVISLSSLFSSNAQAAKIKVRYYNWTRTVKTASQLKKIQCNGKTISQKGTNGIIIQNTSMVSYYDVFKKGMKATCTYNKTSGKITIKWNGVTVKLTLGKKTAYINGKKKKLSVAPLKIKYYAKKKTKVMVPARFVFEAFQCQYNYDSSKRTVTVIQPTLLKYDGKWHIYKSYQGKIALDGNDIDTAASMYAIKRNKINFIPAKQVYTKLGCEYSYQSDIKQITLKNDTHNLVMTIGETNVLLDDAEYTLSQAPVLVKRKDTNKTYVMVPASEVAKLMGYQYSWDTIAKKITLRTLQFFSWTAKHTDYDTNRYTNAINKAELKYDPVTKKLQFVIEGVNATKLQEMIVTEDVQTKQILIDFPVTANLLEEQQKAALTCGYIQSVHVNEMNDLTTRFTIQRTDTCYYTHEFIDNKVVFSFMATSGSVGNISTQMTMIRPQGVTFDQINYRDLYKKNTFVIQIPGNHVDFFNQNPLQLNTKVVTSHTVTLSADGTQTFVTLVTSRLQGFQLCDNGDTVGVRIGDPKTIFKNIVVLDAGHGGHDPGATSSSTYEKNMVISILYDNASKYFNAKDSKIKAYWTREDDTFVDLYERAAYANKVGADVFVSLHMNSWVNSTPTGTEVYYSKDNTHKTASGLTSSVMASMMKNSLVSALGMTDRGVSSQGYVVVKKNVVPSILIELGFISNANDRNKFLAASNQNKAAATIYNTLVNMFEQYPTGR